MPASSLCQRSRINDVHDKDWVHFGPTGKSRASIHCSIVPAEDTSHRTVRLSSKPDTSKCHRQALRQRVTR